MNPNRMPLLAPAVLVLAVAVALGWYSWNNRAREFRGTLKDNSGVRPHIPEEPSAVAYLIVPGGFYHLIFSSHEDKSGKDKPLSNLAQLDGRTVIVRGRLEVRHNRFQGNRPYEVIHVQDLQPAPASPTTAPGA
jgi:hypothetical protein